MSNRDHLKCGKSNLQSYRAVDKQGKTVDFLLTSKRDMAAAKRFFDKAMGANGDPEKIAMDKSGANKAAIDGSGANLQLS